MKILYVTSILILLFSCITNKTRKNEALANEAKKISLEIVKGYFENDCDTFINSLSDTLSALDYSNQLITKDIPLRIRRSCDDAVRDKSKTFEDYLSDYEHEILTTSEFENKFKRNIPKQGSDTSKNFYFVGGILKNKEKKNYIWDDMFVFMIRKEKNGWKIRAFAD